MAKRKCMPQPLSPTGHTTSRWKSNPRSIRIGRSTNSATATCLGCSMCRSSTASWSISAIPPRIARGAYWSAKTRRSATFRRVYDMLKTASDRGEPIQIEIVWERWFCALSSVCCRPAARANIWRPRPGRGTACMSRSGIAQYGFPTRYGCNCRPSEPSRPSAKIRATSKPRQRYRTQGSTPTGRYPTRSKTRRTIGKYRRSGR